MLNNELFENKTKHNSNHIAKSYTGLYGLHKYWGKKPYNIMSDFIQKYTTQNDVVLDPFLGSGVTVTEAVFNMRKAIGIDINPIATFITEQILEKINPKELNTVFKDVENDIKNQIDALYRVVRNDIQYTGQNYLWEENKITEVRFTNGTYKRISTEPQDSDIKLAESIKRDDIEKFYPKTKFFHNSRINAKGTLNISDLFTSRNLYALTILYDRICQIKNEIIKNMFIFCFTSAIGQASKMVFVIKRRNKFKNNIQNINEEKKEVGSWVIGYWQPNEFFENNVWTCFETRFKKLIKAKKEQYNLNLNYNQTDSIEELAETKQFLIKNSPSQFYLKSIPNDSIDYILTDPPHGNRIPYLELSMLWNGWLQKNVDYNSEIVVSEAKERNKNMDNYKLLMSEVIKECYRVLKPEKYFSLMFNSLDDDTWEYTFLAFHSSGFELKSIETISYSANSVVQDNRKNGLQTDFIITFIKPKYKSSHNRLEIINIENNSILIDEIGKNKNLGLKSYQIINNIIIDLLKQNKFIKISQLLRIINNA